MDKNRMKKRKTKPDGSFESTDDALLGVKLHNKEDWCKDKGVDKDKTP